MAELTESEKQALLDHLNRTDNPHATTAELVDAVRDGHVTPEIIQLPSNLRPSPGKEGRLIIETDTLLIKRDTGTEWITVGDLGDDGVEQNFFSLQGEVSPNSPYIFVISGTTQGAVQVNTFFAEENSDVDFVLEGDPEDNGSFQISGTIKSFTQDSNERVDQLNQFYIDSNENLRLKAVTTTSGTFTVGISGREARKFDEGNVRNEIYTIMSETDVVDDLSTVGTGKVEFKVFISLKKAELEIDKDGDSTYEDSLLIDSGVELSQKNSFILDSINNQRISLKPQDNKSGFFAIGLVK